MDTFSTDFKKGVAITLGVMLVIIILGMLLGGKR